MGSFTLPGVLTSKVIAKTGEDLSSAMLTVPQEAMSDSSAFTFFLSNDGGSSFEQVENGVRHFFSSSGGELVFQIIGNPGETLSLKNNPLKIKYW